MELRKAEEKFLTAISEYLEVHEETLAVAESVTSGLLQSRLSLAKNATMFFQGGVTAYNLGQKVKHLDIDPIVAERCNCVGERIARDMAVNVSRKFNSTWGIAITGYAAPVPALKVKRCFALFAISRAGTVVHEGRLDTNITKALAAQQYYARTLINELATHFLSRSASL
jgi:PncC family amidohydrolase